MTSKMHMDDVRFLQNVLDGSQLLKAQDLAATKSGTCPGCGPADQLDSADSVPEYLPSEATVAAVLPFRFH